MRMRRWSCWNRLRRGRRSPAVGARIIAWTGGNPLALVEVTGELSPGQLTGAEMLPEPLPIGGSLEQAFRRRVSRLVPAARLLLAVVAAEPTGSQALLWRAAGQLGIDPDMAVAADLGGLAAIGPRVEFRHPLVRSVVYYATPFWQRRLVHQALAAGDGSQPDGVAWHLGMAAAGPDEAVAARLEEAAGQARDRGGYAATVTFLSRAAELSKMGRRARRLLAASEAALTAGQPVRAGALLEEATQKLGDPLTRAQVRRLQGTFRFAVGGRATRPRSCLRRRRHSRHRCAHGPSDAARGTGGSVVRRRPRAGPSWPRSRPRRARRRAGRSPRRPTCCLTASPPGPATVTRQACRCCAAAWPSCAPRSSLQ